VLAADPSMADGVFSVDPFTKGDLGGEVSLPGLYWGFDVSTCFVTKEAAAGAYYGLTAKAKRIFVRVQKEYVNSKCGYSPKYYHCSIVDGGCTACTNCLDTPEYFFEDVADSVVKFSKAFATRSWTRDTLSLKSTTPADYFVAEEVGTQSFVNATSLMSKAFSMGGRIVDLPGQQFSVHVPETAQDSCEAVLFSVGTAVSVGGYDSMAAALVKRGFAVAIVDPEKNWPTKLNVDKLRDAYAHAKENLVAWSNGACGSISKWLIGGHSAGGGTAHKVLAVDPSMADGIFSVDPFTKGDLGGALNLPGLYWGFDVSTCFVTKEQAASAYYGLSEKSKRIFVRVQKEYITTKCGYSPKYYHCSIVDGGCTACTNCMDTPEYFFEDVADTVLKFSKAFAIRSWTRDTLSLKSATPADYFVAEDV